MEFAAVVMDLKNNPASSWKANGKKANMHKENAQVFAKHFTKDFNNLGPLLCDDRVLPLVPTCNEFTVLDKPPSYDELQDAMMMMANGKFPGPSCMTLNSFRAMVWCKAKSCTTI
eukprot:11054781-Ditylum_brightwellii.AAC.1